MKLTALATAALAASTITFTPAAMAGGCYTSTAVDEMNNLIAGGATLNQAWGYVKSEGVVDGSDMCWTKVKGYTRRYRAIKPYLYKAIWG